MEIRVKFFDTRSENEFVESFTNPAEDATSVTFIAQRPPWEYEGSTFAYWRVYEVTDGIPSNEYIDYKVADDITSDKDLYAYAYYKVDYIEVPTCTITFNPQGGLCLEEKRTIEKGVSITYLPTVGRLGHEFLGWYTTPEGGEPVGPSDYFSEDVTLYAQWRVIVYDITFVCPEGAYFNDGTTVKSYPLPYGSSFRSLYDFAPVPMLDNHTFAGWFDASNFRFNIDGVYPRATVFNAKFTPVKLWDCVPVMIAGKPVAARPYVYTNGQWKPASPRVYSGSRWNRVACPGEYGYAPSVIDFAHMPYQEGCEVIDGTIYPVLADFNETEVVLSGQTTATEPGFYRMAVTPRGKYRWSDGSMKTRDLIWEAVNDPDSKILHADDVPVQAFIPMYTGSAITPQFVYDPKKIRIDSVVETDAGEYEVTATALGDYEWGDDVEINND